MEGSSMKPIAILLFTVISSNALATVDVLPSRSGRPILHETDFALVTETVFDVSQYAQVRVQPIHDVIGRLDHAARLSSFEKRPPRRLRRHLSRRKLPSQARR